MLAAPQECPSRPLCGVALEQAPTASTSSKYLPFAFDAPAAKKQVTDGKAQLVARRHDRRARSTRTASSSSTTTRRSSRPRTSSPIVGKGSPIADDAEVDRGAQQVQRRLTTADLAALNDKVDVDREKAADVAKEYLESKGSSSTARALRARHPAGWRARAYPARAGHHGPGG